MYLIESGQNQSGASRLCVHVGSGVVGKAIVDRLLRDGQLLAHRQVEWSSVGTTIDWLKNLHLARGNYDSIDLVWAAGKARFIDPIEVTAKEASDFESVVQALVQKFSPLGSRLRLWLMSSAGGLFEGQTRVDSQSECSGERPYAKMKRFQEECASKICPTVICRISSVYSVHNFSGRMGLIPTLMRNSFQNRVSTITGDPSTLRDYVLDDDIGRFVCNGINLETQGSGIHYLIYGRSLSIQTIIDMIEGITYRKLLLKFSRKNRNDANMSFSPRIRAESFHPGPILSNIRILHQNILSNQII